MTEMNQETILAIRPLGFPWETQDPFLFCAYHADAYPKGNEQLGPDASLAGRNIGQDFQIKDGWRMYHGSTVPGFPAHPHRGFETVTIVKKGLVDHSDSLGAAGRFGNGDVQWMTAGRGVQHSEMFPLLKSDEENPFELFQIWLNLPRAKKFVEPHFAMLWSEDIPKLETKDESGKITTVDIIAGSLGGTESLKSAPDSWAHDPQNEVNIWTIKLEANAKWTTPKGSASANRVFYYYEGGGLKVDGQNVQTNHAIQVAPNAEVTIENGDQPSFLLMLHGKPLNEPVVQYGPFVMNNEMEIREAMMDYQRTSFGGWPWPSHDHVHPKERGRFALHADGREEIK